MNILRHAEIRFVVKAAVFSESISRSLTIILRNFQLPIYVIAQLISIGQARSIHMIISRSIIL